MSERKFFSYEEIYFSSSPGRVGGTLLKSWISKNLTIQRWKLSLRMSNHCITVFDFAKKIRFFQSLSTTTKDAINFRWNARHLLHETRVVGGWPCFVVHPWPRTRARITLRIGQPSWKSREGKAWVKRKRLCVKLWRERLIIGSINLTNLIYRIIGAYIYFFSPSHHPQGRRLNRSQRKKFRKELLSKRAAWVADEMLGGGNQTVQGFLASKWYPIWAKENLLLPSLFPSDSKLRWKKNLTQKLTGRIRKKQRNY